MRLALASALLLAACGTASPNTPAADAAPADAPRDAAADAAPDAATVDHAATLYRYLLGRFDSAEQARRDPAFFDISLTACRVAVPDLGARAMYVEQARTGMAPYRQRLYVVEAGDAPARAVSRVFEFRNPREWVGLCGMAMPGGITADDVIEREGCAVRVTWMGDRFEGGTEGRGCESTLMGATYATSVVVVRADGFTSWDRGYNAAGMQVWGATSGPYRFTRRSMLEP